MIVVQAKKRLGQHFLTDRNIAQKICNALLPTTGALLEIGPGTGVLTQYLLHSDFPQFLAIDVDRESIEYLHAQYPDDKGRLLEGDFLSMNLDTLFAGDNFSIIGNLPYNISSQIFFKILEVHDRIPQVVCMIQKEVAERLASPHNTKSYGILSVFLQTYYTIEYLFTVSQKVFAPPPKVLSAVIRLTRNERKALPCAPDIFHLTVKTAFNQRRKTLRNSLKTILPIGFQSEALSLRPEQLTPDDFIRLSCEIEEARIKKKHEGYDNTI